MAGLCAFRSFLVRKVNGERASSVRLALDLDMPEVRVHDLLGNRQPQAGPADSVRPLRLDPEEIFEDSRQVSRGYPDARVADVDPDEMGLAGRLDRDGTVFHVV